MRFSQHQKDLGQKGSFKSPGWHSPLISSVRSLTSSSRKRCEKLQLMKHARGPRKAAIPIYTEEHLLLSTCPWLLSFIIPHREAARTTQGRAGWWCRMATKPKLHRESCLPGTSSWGKRSQCVSEEWEKGNS